MQKQTKTQETQESIWNKHWKDFYNTLGSKMPSYYRFDYTVAKDYLISLLKYYFYLNNYYNLQTAEYVTLKNYSNEALNSIFVKLYNDGYPIARNLIVYAWISKWKEATDILSNDSEYKKIIPEYHAMQVDDKQFLSILCDCKTKDQAVQLIKAYKPRHDIESKLTNTKWGREITPFLDLVWQEKPDFVLEAFIIAGWDVNEHRHVTQGTEVTVLYKAFHAQRYKIVRLLLEAGANPKYYSWSVNDDTEEDMPYFHSFETFVKKSRTTQDYIDFAIYAKYVIDRLLDNKDVKEIKYVQTALQWFERLKTFELMVLRGKKDSSNVFSMLNKDVISIIKGYLYVFVVKQN